MSDQLDIEDVPQKPNGMSTSKRAMKIAQDKHAEEMEEYASESIESDNVLSAMFAVHAELDVSVSTDKKGGFNNKYASLPHLLKVTKPIIMKHGLLLRQGAGRTWERDGKTSKALEVYTRLIHVKTREWAAEWIEVPYSRNNVDGAMSALKSGKRSTLKSILAIDDEEYDDDGMSTKAIPLKGEIKIHPDAVDAISEMGKMKKPGDLEDWGKKNAAIVGTMDSVAAMQCRDAYRELMADLEPAPDKEVK